MKVRDLFASAISKGVENETVGIIYYGVACDIVAGGKVLCSLSLDRKPVEFFESEKTKP